MNAKELFEWCKEHNCEDFELQTTDGIRTFDIDPDENDIDRDYGVLTLQESVLYETYK